MNFMPRSPLSAITENIPAPVAPLHFTDSLSDEKKIERIQSLVAQYFQISPTALLSKSPTALPAHRFITYFLAAKITGRDLTFIGNMLGGRGRSAMGRGLKDIRTILQENPNGPEAAAVQEIERLFYQDTMETTDQFDPFTNEQTIDRIQTLVSNHFRIRKTDLASGVRATNLILPRAIAYRLAKDATDFTSHSIGHHFGNRNESAIHAALKVLKTELYQDKSGKLAKSIKEIHDALFSKQEAVENPGLMDEEKITVIQQIVGDHFKLTSENLTSQVKGRKYEIPRYTAYYLSTKLLDQTHTFIGKQFGNRGHLTITLGLKKFDELLTNEKYGLNKNEIEEIRAKVIRKFDSLEKSIKEKMQPVSATADAPSPVLTNAPAPSSVTTFIFVTAENKTPKIDFLAVAAARLPQRPNLLQVKQAVCSVYTGITVQDIEARNDNSRISEARDVACYLSSHACDEFLQAVGESLNRARSDVVHSIEKITNGLMVDPEGPLTNTIRAVLITLEKLDLNMDAKAASETMRLRNALRPPQDKKNADVQFAGQKPLSRRDFVKPMQKSAIVSPPISKTPIDPERQKAARLMAEALPPAKTSAEKAIRGLFHEVAETFMHYTPTTIHQLAIFAATSICRHAPDQVKAYFSLDHDAFTEAKRAIGARIGKNEELSRQLVTLARPYAALRYEHQI